MSKVESKSQTPSSQIATLELLAVRIPITRKKDRARDGAGSCRRALSQCEVWFDGQLDLDPERLVFIAERRA